MTAPAPTELLKAIQTVLENWFGEAIENMEEPARVRKFLLEPLVKAVARQAASVERAEVAGEADIDLSNPTASAIMGAARLHTHDHTMALAVTRDILAALASPQRSEGARASEVLTGEPRFYIDHGMIHDRDTGKHVTTNGEPPFEDSLEQVLELLNSLGSAQEAGHCGALAEFFKWAMREGAWEGCDLDGGGIQDKAESLGLIVKTKFDPTKHSNPNGDYAEGDDYYEFAPGLVVPSAQSKGGK